MARKTAEQRVRAFLLSYNAPLGHTWRWWLYQAMKGLLANGQTTLNGATSVPGSVMHEELWRAMKDHDISIENILEALVTVPGQRGPCGMSGHAADCDCDGAARDRGEA